LTQNKNQTDSQSHSSIQTSDACQQVLALFNAPAGEYMCVFTTGATSALKLVGEAFPWSSKSEYLYAMENHNSKLGI
jgi:molybdenum cofactor sulfurtransferase